MTLFPPGERPRERLLGQGVEVLTDGELLAIALQSGVQGQSSLDLARQLLGVFGGVQGLARATWREIARLRGVGPAKAARIQAAIALGFRVQAARGQRPGPYLSARDVYERLGPALSVTEKESFYALLLDSKNRLIREESISTGTLTASLVH
ncbi:MAG: hypothetical protein O7H41_17155, partial [Planctomycetota bacterium]|nr:hypothetical protein [Planctomycetota bacterium]